MPKEGVEKLFAKIRLIGQIQPLSEHEAISTTITTIQRIELVYGRKDTRTRLLSARLDEETRLIIKSRKTDALRSAINDLHTTLVNQIPYRLLPDRSLVKELMPSHRTEKK